MKINMNMVTECEGMIITLDAGGQINDDNDDDVDNDGGKNMSLMSVISLIEDDEGEKRTRRAEGGGRQWRNESKVKEKNNGKEYFNRLR